MSNFIEYINENMVATIWINNPEKANSLSPDDLKSIRDAIEKVNSNKKINILFLKATGKYFCSGFNIEKMQPESGGSGFEETVNLIENCRAVTVACIQGGVYGGGTDLALACDFRIGLKNTNMFMPAAKLGIHLYGSALRRYVNRLGTNNAKKLVLTAEKIYSEEMLKIGYLTDLFDNENEYEKYISQFETKIKSLAPLSLAYMKKNINVITNGIFNQAAIASDALLVGASKDSMEGRNAWKEKRSPIFLGE